LNGAVIPLISRIQFGLPTCLGAWLAVNAAVAVSCMADPYPVGTVVMRFDPERIQATAAEPTSAVAVRIIDEGRYTGGRALRWDTDTTAEAMRIEGEIPWNEGRHLAMDVYYDAEHAGMMQLRFHAAGERTARLTAGISLFPRLRTRVVFPLELLDAQRVFMPRTAGRLKGVISGRRLNLDELSHVGFAMEAVGGPQRLYVGNVALLSAEPDYPIPDITLVDELGQWTARDWPGKTASSDALKEQLTTALHAARAAVFPEGWSRYGGTKSKRFEATGFFRTEHDGVRWWLVDPEGFAFFSVGLDCVRSGESGAVLEGMEKLHAWLPPADGRFAPAVGRRGDTLMVDFGKANLVRAFGDDWLGSWRELTLGRMRAWRFNTIANWSELEALRPIPLPYVMQLSRYPTTPTLLFRDFPDVFADEFREAARRYARQLEPVKNDPFLIGYFLSNEPLWGFGRFNLASEMLESNPGTATRRELAAWVRRKYDGDVDAWSRAWGKSFRAFDELVTDTFRRLGDSSAGAGEDLWEFSREMVRMYVGVPCEEVKRVDPNHLNLGLRYAWIASDLFYDAGELFDVFSINSYQMEPPADVINTIAARTGKPVMIGEFHFGALDRGLPATGLRGVQTQEDRGIAYRRYVERGAAHPNLVGVHYFTLNDQALLGRFDGENYQIGFVDVCHTPYSELVEQAIAAHESMYEVRSGRQEPSGARARERPRIK
jgi:hypothetical protein